MAVILKDKNKQDQFSFSVDKNIAAIKSSMDCDMDVVIRSFRLGNGQKAAVFFIDNLVSKHILGRDFFDPLMKAAEEDKWTATKLKEQVLRMGSVKPVYTIPELISAVLQGLTGLLIEGEKCALIVEAVDWPQRSVQEPATDVVIRGPREGFIESMRSNVALLRRKIHHVDLKIEQVCLGRYSQTYIGIVYIKSIVNKDVLAELKQRLKRIDIDAILDSGYIEQLVQDTPYSIFPTIGIAEKPDIAAARILEGRVAVLIDGSPIVLTIPMLFGEGLQCSEDYFTRFYYASWIRIIRVIAYFVTIWLPAIFVAVVSYQQRIIPVKLFLSMAAAEADTPFPVGLALLLIMIAYEILREAGVRLPKPAGQAVSIVGAIVMGDAAVSAGLISAPVLIVLAITVISSFVTTAFIDSSTLLRLIFLLVAWSMGLFGLLIASMIMIMYLCSLESFGVPYFAPFAPLSWQGLKDVVVRFPLWQLKFRPRELSLNRRRMGNHIRSGEHQ